MKINLHGFFWIYVSFAAVTLYCNLMCNDLSSAPLFLFIFIWNNNLNLVLSEKIWLVPPLGSISSGSCTTKFHSLLYLLRLWWIFPRLHTFVWSIHRCLFNVLFLPMQHFYWFFIFFIFLFLFLFYF